MEYPYQKQLKEIKQRSYQVVIGVMFGIIIGQKERRNIIYELIEPLRRSQKNEENEEVIKELGNFVQLNITEGLTVQLKLCIIVGVFVSIPIMWIQVQYFISGGLYKKEQKKVRKVGIISWMLLNSGVYFTEKQLLPRAWSFFLSYGDGVVGEEEGEKRSGKGVGQIPGFGNYVLIFSELIFGIIITSQLPVIVYILINWGQIKQKELVKGRPQVIIIILIWSALITPPDLISQVLIFIPLFGVQELTILIQIFKKRYKKGRGNPQGEM